MILKKQLQIWLEVWFPSCKPKPFSSVTDLLEACLLAFLTLLSNKTVKSWIMQTWVSRFALPLYVHYLKVKTMRAAVNYLLEIHASYLNWDGNSIPFQLILSSIPSDSDLLFAYIVVACFTGGRDHGVMYVLWFLLALAHPVWKVWVAWLRREEAALYIRGDPWEEHYVEETVAIIWNGFCN